MSYDNLKFEVSPLPPQGSARWEPAGVPSCRRLLPSDLRPKKFLPCLYSNNSIQCASESSQDPAAGNTEKTVLALADLLTPHHKRQAHTLYSNVKRLVEIEAPTTAHVGFLTLTFKDNVTDAAEAYGRFRSMNSNWLVDYPEIGSWCCTKERQARGSWHYHQVVVLREDIRTGFDFSKVKEGDYRSASPYLREIWRDLRENLPNYGFGRSELMPIASNPEAIARYVGKYIGKHVGARASKDKGVRLVSYGGVWLRNSCRIAWASGSATEWRWKLAKWASELGCTEFYQITAKLGTGWAYKFAKEICEVDLCSASTATLGEYADKTVKEIRETKAIREAAEVQDLIKARKHQHYNRAKEDNRTQVRNHLASLDVPSWLEEPPF